MSPVVLFQYIQTTATFLLKEVELVDTGGEYSFLRDYLEDAAFEAEEAVLREASQAKTDPCVRVSEQSI